MKVDHERTNGIDLEGTKPEFRQGVAFFRRLSWHESLASIVPIIPATTNQKGNQYLYQATKLGSTREAWTPG